MEKWKNASISEIIEPDFGCEGIPEGVEPMAEIILVYCEGEISHTYHCKMKQKDLWDSKLDDNDTVEFIKEKAIRTSEKEYRIW